MNEEPAIEMGGMAGSSDEVPHRRTDISALRLKLAQVRERIRSSECVQEQAKGVATLCPTSPAVAPGQPLGVAPQCSYTPALAPGTHLQGQQADPKRKRMVAVPLEGVDEQHWGQEHGFLELFAGRRA